MINPNFTMSAWDYERHQSNDVFWLPNKYCSEEKKNQERPAEAELTRQREESFTRKLASEGRDGVQTFVKSLIVIFIDLVIFFIHWTIGQKARHNATA